MSEQVVNKNKELNLSEAGAAFIAKEEGFSYYPYDDIAGHCTVGNGVLLHYGPCTPEQKSTKYDTKNLSAMLNTRLNEAQRYVRLFVTDTALSQHQFDALTSFVFNVGVGNAKPVLKLANDGDFLEAGKKMSQYIWVTQKKSDGSKVKVKANGLVNRRAFEVIPFQIQSSEGE